jgi:hypothetical protein
VGLEYTRGLPKIWIEKQKSLEKLVLVSLEVLCVFPRCCCVENDTRDRERAARCASCWSLLGFPSRLLLVCRFRAEFFSFFFWLAWNEKISMKKGKIGQRDKQLMCPDTYASTLAGGGQARQAEIALQDGRMHG